MSKDTRWQRVTLLRVSEYKRGLHKVTKYKKHLTSVNKLIIIKVIV